MSDQNPYQSPEIKPPTVQSPDGPSWMPVLVILALLILLKLSLSPHMNH